jgi:4-aminobutyrate aminotransferase-like enzyme
MDDAFRIDSPQGNRRDRDPNFGPLFVRGEGPHLWDSKGNRYIDFIGGYSSTLFGHAHPKLVSAAREQLGTLTQLVGLAHPWRFQLENELARRVAPWISSPAKTWLTTGGARAVELAWKIAAVRRPGSVLSFDGAYHGRSLATSQISHTKRLPIVHASVETPIRYPRCERCPLNLKRESCRAECFDEDEQRIDAIAERLSAVFVEPALGARGYYFAPPIFFQRLSNACRRNGIAIIDDEIQMGLGRLGTFLAIERQGWQPDLVILGKSLAGGLVPMSAVIGRSDWMDGLPEGIESETFAANPLACRIGLEALQTLDDESLFDRAFEIESIFRRELKLLSEAIKFPIEFDVCGASAVIQTTRPLAEAWTRNALKQGLLVHWSGINYDRIVLIPPLIAEASTIREAIETLKKSQPS